MHSDISLNFLCFQLMSDILEKKWVLLKSFRQCQQYFR
jgi:hypothetical protein